MDSANTDIVTFAATAAAALAFHWWRASRSSSGGVADESKYTVSTPWWIKGVGKWVSDNEAPALEPPRPAVPAPSYVAAVAELRGKFAGDEEEALVSDPAAAALDAASVAAGLPAFGKDMRNKWFTVDPTIAFLNHGSYGATLRFAQDAQAFYRQRLEHQPVRFMEDEALGGLVAALRDLASFVGSRPENVAFVPNATSGCHTVIHSMNFAQGDVVLAFVCGYPAVLSSIDYACKRSGARLVRIPLEFPMQEKEALVTVESVLKEYPQARLAVFDHIPSFPGVVVPAKKLVALCHNHNVELLLDGAHAVGQIPLQLDDLGADYYTSNCHKWLCAPKGCAFLWVHPSHHSTVHPVIVSHGYTVGLQEEFIWQATMDYTGYLSVAACVATYRLLGPKRIMARNHNLALWAGNMLAKAWGTDLLSRADHVGSLVVVRVPDGNFTAKSNLPRMSRTLRYDHDIECVICAYNGSIYTRVSAQMYNYKAEYYAFASAVLRVQGLEVPSDVAHEAESWRASRAS